MTDTSKEAVEAMAVRIADWGCGNGSIEAPAMLRALLDERDEAEARAEGSRVVLGAAMAQLDKSAALRDTAIERYTALAEKYTALAARVVELEAQVLHEKKRAEGME